MHTFLSVFILYHYHFILTPLKVTVKVSSRVIVTSIFKNFTLSPGQMTKPRWIDVCRCALYCVDL